MSVEELQAVLDESRRAASSFTKSLEGDEQQAGEVETFINTTRNVIVAVVRRSGLPHATPVIGGCVYGGIYVAISPGSVLAACLKRSPEVAITVADLIHNVIGAGTAKELGRPSDLGELCGVLDQVSPYGSFAPEGWDGLIYRFHPRRLFAW